MEDEMIKEGVLGECIGRVYGESVMRRCHEGMYGEGAVSCMEMYTPVCLRNNTGIRTCFHGCAASRVLIGCVEDVFRG